MNSFQLIPGGKIGPNRSGSFPLRKIPFRELTYPTLGKRKVIFKGALGWDMLVPSGGKPRKTHGNKLSIGISSSLCFYH